jgi:signal transduction histidine kinase
MANTLEQDIKIEHRLTSDVAHELRTPLMAMLATVEAMQDGVLPSDDEHFEVVASEVRRLSRLVDAMLHLSRMENNDDFKTERTDLVYAVKSLVSMQEQLFAERDLRLRFDDKTPSHELYADVNPDLIREAITNIMSNAMRYTPEGGWVVVSVDRDRTQGEAIISVRDTGIGIAKEDIPRIFSRFWRSDASRERVSGGLGVGLALTKEIVDKHHGSISVESELGKGTTFTLRIPLERPAQDLDSLTGDELIG